METYSVKQRETGFTLIELMIAVSIIGILVAIAYPNYTAYLVKTRRADTQAVLANFANALERYYTQNNTYLGAGTAANTNGDANSAGAPSAAVFPSQAPLDGTDKYYNLTIVDSTATSYTLRAAPFGVQTADGYMELDSTGARRWDRNNDGDTDDADETKW